MRQSAWMRGGFAGLAGGVAWFIGIMVFFGPAQLILADPELQSAKMIAAFTDGPPPRAAEQPWILIVGLLVIGMIWGIVYGALAKSWHDSATGWAGRGVRFAAIGWALMVPWFVFFLPWNVMREPTLLALVEMVCWAGVLLPVGLTIAGVDHVLRRRAVAR